MADHSKTIQALTAENDVLKKRIRELEAVEVDRKRAEEKLLLIQKAVEDSSDAIALADARGNHFYQNKAFTRLLRYTVDELKVQGVAQTVYADQEVARNVFKTIMQGGSWSGEVEDIAKDGRRLTVMLRADAIKDENGKIIGLLAINTDITEQKQAEESLSKSERKFSSTFHLNPNAMAISDIVTSKFIDVNEAFISQTGYSREEIIGKSAEDLQMWVNPDDRKQVINALKEKGEIKGTEVLMRLKNDNIRNVLFSARFIEIEQDHYLLTFALDITERKQMENELRASESNFRHSLDESPLGVRISTVEGETIYANKAILDIYEYGSIEELKKTSIKERYTPQSYAEFQERREKRLKGKFGPSEYAISIVRKNGEIRHLQVFRKEIFWGGNKQSQIIYQDITERKLAEEELRSREEHLRSIFENAEDIIHLIAWDGTFLHLSPSWERYTGFPVSETVGKSFVSYVHPDDQAACREVVKKVYETGQPHKISEFRVKHASGKWIWFMNSGAAIKDARGNLLYFSGVATDITERKQVEEDIKRANTLLNSIVENIPNMIFLKDARELRYTQLNQAGEELLGHSRGDLLGKNDYNFFPKEQADFFTQKDREVLRGKEIVEIQEEAIQTRDRGERILHTKKVPILNAEGEPEYLMGISEDITDRKQAEAEKRRLEERLRRAEKMEALGQLAGGVAHDLNNVLGVLSGYSELLLAEIPEGQTARKHVEKILQSTEKGAAIIQDLLTLARRGVISEEVIQVNDIVSGFFKTPAFENIRDYHPRVTFRTECDPNLLNIKGSPVHLEKTLMNLLSNAAEAISGEGEVAIRTENRYLDKAIVGYDEVKEGDYAVLIVSDTGTGIADEHREKIFEPFYTKKTMGRSGTGLGLSIVWGTVKDHNGYIDVKTKIGAGTSFTLYFPATRESTGLPTPRTPVERYMGQGESVLVVDDIAEQRDVASGLLQKLGYKVHSVSSGEAALEYLKENRADILILDMIMAPGMDGMETYRKVLEIHPKQKTILVSGFSETDRVRKAQLLGAGVYVKKPYVMATIGLAIRKELER